MKRYLCENNYAYFYVWYDYYTLHVDPQIKSNFKPVVQLEVHEIERLPKIE